MSAGLYDITEYPDIEVESNIVNQYTADTSDFIVKTCCSLLGSKAITEDSPALAFLKQNQSYFFPANMSKAIAKMNRTNGPSSNFNATATQLSPTVISHIDLAVV